MPPQKLDCLEIADLLCYMLTRTNVTLHNAYNFDITGSFKKRQLGELKLPLCEFIAYGLTAVNYTIMDYRYVFIVEAIKYNIDNTNT